MEHKLNIFINSQGGDVLESYRQLDSILSAPVIGPVALNPLPAWMNYGTPSEIDLELTAVKLYRPAESGPQSIISRWKQMTGFISPGLVGSTFITQKHPTITIHQPPPGLDHGVRARAMLRDEAIKFSLRESDITDFKYEEKITCNSTKGGFNHTSILKRRTKNRTAKASRKQNRR